MNNEPLQYPAPRRRISFDQIWGVILLLAVAGGVIWLLASYFRTQTRENHAAAVRQQRDDASIAALILKYNAVTNWEVSLPDRGGAQPFSIDVSRALNTLTNPFDAFDKTYQPVLIKCSINDIFEKSGKSFASLSSVDTTNSLSLELQCSRDQAATLASTNQLSNFAVVFKCQEVQRLSGDDEGFSVKGELLDAVQLP